MKKKKNDKIVDEIIAEILKLSPEDQITTCCLILCDELDRLEGKPLKHQINCFKAFGMEKAAHILVPFIRRKKKKLTEVQKNLFKYIKDNHE